MISKNILLVSQIVVIGSLMGGCAGKLTKNECESKDFYQQGLNDGKDGRAADRFDKMKQQCSDQGVKIDDTKYSYGRKVGLASYCDSSRAESDAKKGKTDSICLAEQVPPYQRAYQNELGTLKAKSDAEMKSLSERQQKLQDRQGKVESQQKQIEQQQQVIPQ